jgi:hypothetical protein
LLEMQIPGSYTAPLTKKFWGCVQNLLNSLSKWSDIWEPLLKFYFEYITILFHLIKEKSSASIKFLYLKKIA